MAVHGVLIPDQVQIVWTWLRCLFRELSAQTETCIADMAFVIATDPLRGRDTHPSLYPACFVVRFAVFTCLYLVKGVLGCFRHALEDLENIAFSSTLEAAFQNSAGIAWSLDELFHTFHDLAGSGQGGEEGCNC